MRHKLKCEVADAAGVSMRTFQRWMMEHKKELEGLGVKTSDHLLKPRAVRWIYEQYGIEWEG